MLETEETRAVTTAKFVEEPWNRPTVADDPSDALLGVTLSDTYVVERVVGEGGMGRVYLARHTRITQKRVAVKVLHPQYSSNTEVLARFQREAEAAAAVCHPNVLTVFDVARTPKGQPYLVCEYLEGSDLSERLKAEGKLTISEAVHIARQICRGLGAAHASGVVHRDLKPQNIFLTGDLPAAAPARPEVKILDFGLSRFLSGASGNQLTKAGVIMGTPSYMAPEQARAEPVDHRADVYGVGAILYTVLTGRPPFLEDTPHETVLAVLHGTPPSPRALEPRIPEALEAVICRAIARDPNARYEDAAALERALESYESSAAADALPSLAPRMALLPEPAPRELAALPAAELARAPADFSAVTPDARLALALYAAAAIVLFVGAAATAVPGVELASAYRFNRVEIALFLLAITGSALTPALVWFLRSGRSFFRDDAAVADLHGQLRGAVLTFVLTYGLGTFTLELIDGCLVRLFGDGRITPAGADFAGWNLLLPLLALTTALGRVWLYRLTERVRPGWRRLLASWSVASLLFMVMGSIVVVGLHWRDQVERRAQAASVRR